MHMLRGGGGSVDDCTGATCEGCGGKSVDEEACDTCKG